MLGQILRVPIYDDSGQLVPRQHVEPITSFGVCWRDLNHDADQIWIGIRQLSADDLLRSVKHDLGKLAERQLPGISRDGLYLDQGVAPLVCALPRSKRLRF